MNDRVQYVKRCGRAKRPHELLRVEVVEGETVVITKEAKQRRTGREVVEQTYRLADMEDFDALTVTVTCPCGRAYSVDLVSIFAGQPASLRREPPFEAHGVSSRRYKAPRDNM
jgi:hypothetical protein